MSLTSILNYSNKDFKDFRDLLSSNFPKPKFESSELLKAEPQTKDYALIGTAYDYLLRFNLEKRYKKKVFAGKWVAESALGHFKEKSKGFFVSDGQAFKISSEELRGYFERRRINEEIQRKRIPVKFKECKKIYQQFIKSRLRDKNRLIESTLFLGRLDSVYRVGPTMKEHINFLPEDPLNIDDLRRIEAICDLKIFKPKNKIVLNPTFGKGSILVGGADADIIIDDMLVDIKVTKELRLTRPHFNQIIGYYLLYLIGGVDKHKDIRINRLGIYFARHNVMWTIKIEDLGEKDLFNRTIDLLKKKIKKVYR